jgi:hypothetical protein
MGWLEKLASHAERHPVVVLRFSADEWDALMGSQRGATEFTVARSHAYFDDVKVPAPCLILGKSGGTEQIYFGLLSSKKAVTTLESRIKISRSVEITPSNTKKLIAIITEAPYAKNFSKRLQSRESVTPLSPKLSRHLVTRLATIQSNNGGMRAIAESLTAPKRFTGNVALEEDAVQTALAAFGLTPGAQASSVELAKGRPTALGRVSIIEDSVVEHDARSVPGYALIRSDVTGRALFKKGEDQLEVFTANRRDLEHCFGVDLIYVNLTKHNVVMLQYKMLEPAGKVGEATDWIYRPDSQLDTEIARMKAFAVAHAPGPKEFRLNPQIFYLKFVKRDAKLGGSGIIMPLDHFEIVRTDKSFKGPKAGVRLSYSALNGRYLRQDPFLDLVRCGYVGAYARTTAKLRALIAAILAGDKAVVVAVQQKVSV